MFLKRTNLLILVLVGVVYFVPCITAGGADITVIRPNFYDPNYHDDGRNHLRSGPTAASSQGSISILSPYAASSSSNEQYKSGPPFMAVIDHYYGPNGEEKVQYSNPTGMDKEELEQIISNVGSSNNPNSYQRPSSHSPSYQSQSPSLSYQPPSQYQSHNQLNSYSTPKLQVPPQKYGGGASLSSMYKPSSSHSPGYSLPALYKSQDSYSKNQDGYSKTHDGYPKSHDGYSKTHDGYSKTTTTYRPAAFSTIYKDPQTYLHSPPKHQYSSGGNGAGHYIKGSDYTTSSKDSVFSPSYQNNKEPILLHSPREHTFVKPPSNYYSDAPKSISDAILSDSYKSYSKPGMDDDERGNNYNLYAPSPSSSYAPPAPASHQSHHHYESVGLGGAGGEYSIYNNNGQKQQYTPSTVTIVKDDYSSYGKGHLKAGLHSLPMKYSPHSQEYGAPPPAPHHETYSSGFGGGYSLEEPSSPYSKPGKTIISSSHGGHSLQSLYEPLTVVDEMYSNPKTPYYGAPTKHYPGGAVAISKPLYGPPPPPQNNYAMSLASYGPPVEYRMPAGAPPPNAGYVTSSSPFGSTGPGSGLLSPRYKGPYRTVNSGPGSGYGYGYGYGKPHAADEERERFEVKPSRDDVIIVKDKYDDEPKLKPLHLHGIPPPQLYQQRPHHHSLSPIRREQVRPHYPHKTTRLHHDNEQRQSERDAYKKAKTYNHYDIITADDVIVGGGGVLQKAEGSDEVVNIHLFEKGFFEKEERLKKKQWTPPKKNPIYSRGGMGSASMELDAQAHAASLREETIRKSRTSSKSKGIKVRPPPPSRRTPIERPNRRPYHNASPEEDNTAERSERRLKHGSNESEGDDERSSRRN